MSSYGRNLDFRISPESNGRHGRFVLTGTVGTNVALGAPVIYDSVTAVNTDFGTAVNVKLATGAQAPTPGLCGILLYEHAPAAFAGNDPFLTTYSDKDTAPVGKLVQVVSGAPEVKAVFKNTTASTFLNARTYAGRIMVAGLGGATPTVKVNDLLTPGTGDDVNGYWAVTLTTANGWLRVVNVDNARNEAEVQMLF